MSDLADRLQAMLDAGHDSALLRFGLGQALLGSSRAQEAVTHLAAALEQDPGHSVAWKLLGKAYTECGDPQAAMTAYERGMEVAQARGDKQAALEMGVFLKRLRKAAGKT